MWHFSDNQDTALDEDRLRKISALITQIIERYQDVYTPGLKVCIDETMVPFRDRLKFTQYIKNKKHKFCIKVYKLCCEGGYTYNFQVYCGNDKAQGGLASSNVVLSLMQKLLDSGRQLFTDNYYTSVSLATELLTRKRLWLALCIITENII
ncbi:Transposase IS4 [Popillia japonica]|uniref:Transposase IS4 n=1 Tax=Popillia japonica TaxID=7064 RepID=A0AAW1LY58_POPJA